MMKRVLSTSAIECNDLARTLELKGASVLLIDCRSFMDFNHCHIINAHNVHFPPIVKRRSGGSVRLERHVLRCPRTRSRLQAGHFSLVVVYDHNSSSLNDLPEDSIMNLVIRCLDSEDRIHNLRFLEGGFSKFLATASHLCFGTNMSELATTLAPSDGHMEESRSPRLELRETDEPSVTVQVSSPSPVSLYSPAKLPLESLRSLDLGSIEGLPALSPASEKSALKTEFTFPSLKGKGLTPLGQLPSMDCLALPHQGLLPTSRNSSHRPISPRHCHSTPSSPYSPNLRCLRYKSFSTQKLKQNSFDTEEPVEILPWLYLGSVEHAQQGELLQTMGVSALLNVSLSELSQMTGQQFCCKTIPIADSSTSLINQWFPEAIDFIEMVRENGGKVLVHCHAGVSRSATICIAYLMFHKRLSMEQAYDYLKARRHIINPNWNFMTQLQEYEKQLNVKRAHNVTSASTMTSQSSSAMKLSLTPLTPIGCNQEAGVFVFDTSIPPIGTPSPVRHSPLISPS